MIEWLKRLFSGKPIRTGPSLAYIIAKRKLDKPSA